MRVKRILVADDSPTIRRGVQEILAGQGYEVVTAENGCEAVAKAKSESPDAIIMDVVMPEMNGFQATRCITRDPATCHIPIVLLTSKHQFTDRLWGLRQGAREYLVKPVSPQILVEKIRLICDQPTTAVDAIST